MIILAANFFLCLFTVESPAYAFLLLHNLVTRFKVTCSASFVVLAFSAFSHTSSSSIGPVSSARLLVSKVKKSSNTFVAASNSCCSLVSSASASYCGRTDVVASVLCCPSKHQIPPALCFVFLSFSISTLLFSSSNSFHLAYSSLNLCS